MSEDCELTISCVTLPLPLFHSHSKSCMHRHTQTLLTYTTYQVFRCVNLRGRSLLLVRMCVWQMHTLSSFALCWFSKERCSLTDESCSHSCCSLVFFTCICSSSLVDRSLRICHSQRRDWGVEGWIEMSIFSTKMTQMVSQTEHHKEHASHSTVHL